jgi:GNAT superfamily N-acetyltransferase
LQGLQFAQALLRGGLRRVKLGKQSREQNSGTASPPQLSGDDNMPAASQAVTIRAARPDDFARWKPLWDGYNAFYGRSGPTALAPGITETVWSRFFDVYEPLHALVAEAANGELTGLVHFLYHRGTTQIKPECYLEDIFTSEGARGKGVGRALIEAVYAKARADGVPRVYWQTHETNHTAMRLYDCVAAKSGFIVYSQTL